MVLTEVQKLHEECAVFGVSLHKHAQEEAPGICYNGLLAMQHLSLIHICGGAKI